MDWVGVAQDREEWLGFSGRGNELPDSIKCWEVLEWLHNWWPLR
jgi:hypothetical protein